MPAPYGVPLSVSCFSPLPRRTPARSHSSMSWMRGSAILRHHPQKPLVVDRVEEAAYVGIEHPVHALTHDRCMQSIKRHVRIAPRPEAVGEPEEVGLVDGAQHLGHRALDDLVL